MKRATPPAKIVRHMADGPVTLTVEISRDKRLQKSVRWQVRQDTIQVRAPEHIPPRELDRLVDDIVERVRKQFVEEGMDAALERRPLRRQYQRKLDGEGEAHLVALACQEPPEGRSRWTLRLLADRMVALEYVDQLSYQTVRRTLKKTNSNPG